MVAIWGCIDNRMDRWFNSLIGDGPQNGRFKMNKQDLVRISPAGSSRITYKYRGVLLSKSKVANSKVTVFVITESGNRTQFQVEKIKDATKYIDDRLNTGDVVEDSRLRYVAKVNA